MNAVVFLLSAASFVVVAVMTVTGPLLPLIAAEFGRSIGGTGIVVTAFAVPYGVLQIVFGPVGDRAGKIRVIAVTLGVSSVFTLACGFVESLEPLAMLRFASGSAMAATVPLSMAFIADEVPYADRQPVIARYISGLILGQIAGGCAGGIAAEYFDWRVVFVFFAVLSSVIAVVLWVLGRRFGSHPSGRPLGWSQTLSTYAEVFRRRRSRDVVVTAMLEGVLIFGVLAYFGAFLRHRFELSYVVIGLVLSMYGVGGAIYSAAVHHVVRALGERGMVIGGTALLGACYLALPLIPYWWLCLPVFLLAGLGFYTFHNTMQTKATELSPEARGTAVSLWVFMLFVGQGLGVTLFGAAIDRAGYAVVFVIAGVGVPALGYWFWRRLAPDTARG